MRAPKRDIAASVAARLLNRAKETGDEYQNLLTAYALERFLYRLSRSDRSKRFVLKGALLLRVWTEKPYRGTRDLDLLRLGDRADDAVRDDVRAICEVAAEPDGIVFDADSLGIEPIRVQDEYAGTRVSLQAHCGSARLRLQIDLGASDSVWPPPQLRVYPSLLDFPAPELLVYPREAVVAEKLEAMLVLGDRNSRIKDFFDLHHLASRFPFDRSTLVEAIRRTLARRATPIPTEAPIGLTPLYWENPSRPTQMRAFTKRSGLAVPADPAREIGELVTAFLLPVVEGLRGDAPTEATWPPGGPWQPGARSEKENTGSE
ncbi:MAG: nucleotidyl transferase AbiEii/AbiGii toxin family protein [Candidatus Eisenbacteria bacterium]|nr:nucleotidyl transferase AbiEii/AbiGii toxin family protein [Candidatus Eisenbacteria bacterium]